MVENCTAQIIFKAWNYVFPKNVQKLFNKKQEKYNFRLKKPFIIEGMQKLNKQKLFPNVKQGCGTEPVYT